MLKTVDFHSVANSVIPKTNFFSLLYSQSKNKNVNLKQRAIEIFDQAQAASNDNANLDLFSSLVTEILKTEYEAFPAELQGKKDIIDMLGVWDIKPQIPHTEEDHKLITLWMILLAHADFWKRKQIGLDKAIEMTSNAAEVANIGIVLHMAGQWISIFTCGIFASIAFFTDPAIYFCRAAVRLMRLVARSIGLTVEEEVNGYHPWQQNIDILCMCLFVLASLTLAGCILSGPIAATVGWSLALISLCFVAYVDYYHQEVLAKGKYESAQAELDIAVAELAVLTSDKIHQSYRVNYLTLQRDRALDDYTGKKKSCRLYVALLVGLTLLMICGTAAAFAPPAVAIAFLIIAKIASSYLGMINAGRLLNYLYSKKSKVHSDPIQLEMDPLQPKLMADITTSGNINSLSGVCQSFRDASAPISPKPDGLTDDLKLDQQVEQRTAAHALPLLGFLASVGEYRSAGDTQPNTPTSPSKLSDEYEALLKTARCES